MRVFAAQGALLRSIQHTVASRQQSAVDVTKAYLQQLKSVEPIINSFLTVNEEHAIAQVCIMVGLETEHNCLPKPVMAAGCS